LDFAEARYFDSGVGRFSSPDSFLNDSYTQDPSSWNRYVYVRNNPLKYVDPSGEEIWIWTSQERTITNPDGTTKTVRTTLWLQYKGDKLYDEQGKEYSGNNDYANKVLNQLNQLKKDDIYVKWKIQELEKSANKHTITMTTPQFQGGFNGTKAVNDYDALARKPTGSTIYFNPDNWATRYNDDNRNPRVGLAHELSHAFDFDVGQGTLELAENGVQNREIRAVVFENRVRLKTGDKQRISFDGIPLTPRQLGIKTNTGGVHRSWSPFVIKRTAPNYQ
jgi:hypothetical protein